MFSPFQVSLLEPPHPIPSFLASMRVHSHPPTHSHLPVLAFPYTEVSNTLMPKGCSSHWCPTRPSSATYVARAMGRSTCILWLVVQSLGGTRYFWPLQTLSCTHTHRHTHTDTYFYIQTHTHTYIYTLIYTHIHKNVHTLIHTHTNTHILKIIINKSLNIGNFKTYYTGSEIIDINYTLWFWANLL